MALILKDRVKETSSSSGTGSITLGGAFPGYQTFNAAIASGSTVYYTIHNLSAGFDTEWEVGVGTFTSPATLARNTVFSSSTGSLINFTAGTNGLEVFVTQPAEQALYTNQATGKVEVFGNGTNVVTFTEINTTNLTANTVTLTAGTISTNAANATDITNKTYVDGLFSQGVSYHEAVLVESPSTAGSLNVVYVQPNGAGNGVGATLTNNGANVALVVDGVTVSNTARVLIYSQSNAVQNGVYTVTNPGAPDPGGAKWVLTRATDADTFGLANPNTLGAGDAFFVQSGNTGAGETYVCNTQGTITFGSSNITFAQISSAQIYAAGTGLNLSNLTFSIANTAVTAATYGAANAVGTFTVNAQGQITNAANTTISIASSQINDAIPNSGLANSNVVVNGTTINLGGSGTITANTTGTLTIGSYLTGGSFNGGSNVTVAVDGNSSNSANTVVVRDANGAFTSGNITASNFIGAGTTITSINASNISSGTIANARTTAASSNGASTIVSRDSGGNFSANTVTAAVIGDISGGSNINASNISSGTIANARTTASSSNGASTIVLRDAGGAFAAGAITGDSFSGNGSAITAINASAITTGTIANARTTAASANGANTIVSRDASGDFEVDGITANWFTGNGANLSSINASNVSSGTIANARTTAASANGASTIVLRGTSGEFSAGAITAASFSGAGTGLTGTASSLSIGGTATTATTATTANALNTGNNYQVNSLGVGTAASGTAGEIRATNNVTAFYSDERLKTKTGNIENALDKVCQIETMLYHANETAVELGYDASIQEVGVTAQSVQKVQPEIVVPAPVDDKYLTVRYEKLVPLLIEAIKELKAEVDALKGK
jgi:hypothetical protein